MYNIMYYEIIDYLSLRDLINIFNLLQLYVVKLVFLIFFYVPPFSNLFFTFFTFI